jgi:hypothetical protein
MSTATGNLDNKNSGADAMKRLAPIAYVVGIALIVAYFIALALAWSGIDASESEWGRRLQLLGGLEALAFAAAGAILGTTVQRQATQTEKERARAAEQRADTEAVDGEKGRAVVNLVATKAGAPPGGSEEFVAKGLGDRQDAVAEAFRDVLALAAQYDAQRRV